MSRFIPRGVAVAGLGRRLLAAIIDAAPLVLVGGGVPALLAVQSEPSATLVMVSIIAGSVVAAAYGLYQWWAYGTRGAGLGARIMGVRLVGMGDGRSIGWWRVFVRQLVFTALMLTVIGGIALVVFLVIHERRQGWHDMAVSAIVVQPKVGKQQVSESPRTAQAPSIVGLPPHLSSSFSPRVGNTDMGEGPGVGHAPGTPGKQPAPAWMPRLETEPLISTGPSGHNPYARQGGPASSPNPPSQQGQPGRTGPMDQARPVNQGWIPLPTPSSIIEQPRQAPKVRPRDFGGTDDDSDGTRIAAPMAGTGSRPGHQGWYVRLDDGREVELAVTVLLGRNPQKSDDDPDVHLVPAGGDGRMISRTHVLVGTDARGVYVVDRGSTNGTALVTHGGGLEPCPVGTQIRVRDGQQVSYGNRWFTVLRRPERA